MGEETRTVRQLAQNPKRRYCTQGACISMADFVGPTEYKSSGPYAEAYCRPHLPADAVILAEDNVDEYEEEETD